MAAIDGVTDAQLILSILTIVFTPCVTYLTIKYEYKKIDREFALEKRKIDFENKYDTINKTILLIGEYMIKSNNFFEALRSSGAGEKKDLLNEMSSELYNDAKNIIISITLIFDHTESNIIIEKYRSILAKKDTDGYLAYDIDKLNEMRAEDIKTCLNLSDELKGIRDRMTAGK